jgi:hypothetical protein
MTLDRLLDQPLYVINVGLELFAQQLEAEGVTVIQVDWRPPAGEANVAALLARLADDDVER